jgi:hypothetical protein
MYKALGRWLYRRTEQQQHKDKKRTDVIFGAVSATVPRTAVCHAAAEQVAVG